MNEQVKENVQKECVAKRQYHKLHHKLKPEQLTTGFGLHSISSLELALRRRKSPKHSCECKPCGDDGWKELDEEVVGEETLDGQSTITDEVVVHQSFDTNLPQDHLKYLMGLPTNVEEAATPRRPTQAVVSTEFEEETQKFINGRSESMRQAQRYLREHRIFEFFQFLIAHLLSELPYDPIDFLINLCDKLLIYRTGISDPPLLYEKKHIECLFNLMDRMRTGFIDTHQYKTGMQTLGIKSYNLRPPMTPEGHVTKCYFIEEGYECLKDLLDDMIRKRPREERNAKKMPRAPPPTLCTSTSDVRSALE